MPFTIIILELTLIQQNSNSWYGSINTGIAGRDDGAVGISPKDRARRFLAGFSFGVDAGPRWRDDGRYDRAAGIQIDRGECGQLVGRAVPGRNPQP